MIHEEICTYEVCKLAKEKGFNEYETCNHIYEDDEQWHTLTNYTNAKGIDWSKDKFTVAPTQSQLRRWLRKNKGIIVEVLSQPTCDNEQKICYWWALRMNSNGLEFDVDIQDSKTFNEYEEALEDALKYALENLI